MARTSFVITIALLLIACAMAFHAPAMSSRVASRSMSVQMAPVDAVVETTSSLAQFSQLLSSEMDFGGYVGPAGSLIFIAVIILTLAPPLAPKEAD